MDTFKNIILLNEIVVLLLIVCNMFLLSHSFPLPDSRGIDSKNFRDDLSTQERQPTTETRMIPKRNIISRTTLIDRFLRPFSSAQPTQRVRRQLRYRGRQNKITFPEGSLVRRFGPHGINEKRNNLRSGFRGDEQIDDAVGDSNFAGTESNFSFNRGNNFSSRQPNLDQEIIRPSDYVFDSPSAIPLNVPFVPEPLRKSSPSNLRRAPKTRKPSLMNYVSDLITEDLPSNLRVSEHDISVSIWSS